MAANVLKVRDENGDWQAIPAIKGDVGPQGEQGVSGVYVGDDVPPDGYDVWVRPEGEANEMWPVNSIYLSVSDTNPAEMFGGTWVSFGTGRVLVGVDEGQAEFADVEQEGGEKENILLKDNLPDAMVRVGIVSTATSNIPAYRSASAGAQGNWGVVGCNSTIYSTDSLRTDALGANVPVDNLQPYITCYMWKRIA